VGPDTIKHFIGGKHAYSTLRKSYGVLDPGTGREYTQVEVGLGADTNQAVLAARAALESGPWPEMTAADRARVLSAIADAIDARADDIAAAEGQSTGLPVTQSREQAARAGELFRLAAGLITDGPTGEDGGPSPSAYVLSAPAGIAGLITPWGSPFLGQARALAPALAAGCAVVLKADEWAPLPAALLAELTIAAGLPDGVLNIVHGSLHPKALGPQARDALIAHPSVARLSFDGEAVTGQEVVLAATAHGKELSAELAGNSPCLIFADADLDQALDSALFGGFALNGQRRTATSTILAERPVYETVVSRLAERAERIRVGAAADPGTELGPLPHADHYAAIVSLVRLGVREGARLAAGGRRPASLPEGNYLAATVLADVTPEMRVFTEHVRGPVLRVTPFDSDEEAVSLANTATGNTGPGAITSHSAVYLWTTGLERARGLAPAIESASTWVNSRNTHDLLTVPPGHAPGLPGGAAGQLNIDFYTRSRTVVVAADEAPAPRFGA
jgi:5-carboxymethyl-2-hydroxymuconic-semialdehyde dehydrogenase